MPDVREAAWPVELEVCGGCGVIIDIDAASCGCEYPPRRVSKTFYLMHEADFLALAAADREAPDTPTKTKGSAAEVIGTMGSSENLIAGPANDEEDR